MKLLNVFKNLIDKSNFILWGHEERFSAFRVLYEVHSLNPHFTIEEAGEFTSYLVEMEIDPSMVIERDFNDSIRLLISTDKGRQLLHILFASSLIRCNGNTENKQQLYSMVENFHLELTLIEQSEQDLQKDGIETITENWNNL